MPLLPYDYLHLVNCPEVVTISDILCNSTAQIWHPWLNLPRKPELDLLPLELNFLYSRNLAYSFCLLQVQTSFASAVEAQTSFEKTHRVGISGRMGVPEEIRVFKSHVFTRVTFAFS